MTSGVTLGFIDTIADPMMELMKKELAGETFIRRSFRQGQPNVEALHDQPAVTVQVLFLGVLLVKLMLMVAMMMLMLLPVMMMSMLILKKK